MRETVTAPPRRAVRPGLAPGRGDGGLPDDAVAVVGDDRLACRHPAQRSGEPRPPGRPRGVGHRTDRAGTGVPCARTWTAHSHQSSSGRPNHTASLPRSPTTSSSSAAPTTTVLRDRLDVEHVARAAVGGGPAEVQALAAGPPCTRTRRRAARRRSPPCPPRHPGASPDGRAGSPGCRRRPRSRCRRSPAWPRRRARAPQPRPAPRPSTATSPSGNIARANWSGPHHRQHVRLVLGGVARRGAAPGRRRRATRCARSGRSQTASKPSASARSSSVSNLMCSLQRTHGLGVRPAAYSARKSATTVCSKLLGQVPDVVRDAQHVRRAARVVGVLDRAAAARPGAELVAVARQRHVHADDVVTRVARARGGHGGVDPAGQGCQHAHRSRVRGRAKDPPTPRIVAGAHQNDSDRTPGGGGPGRRVRAGLMPAREDRDRWVADRRAALALRTWEGPATGSDAHRWPAPTHATSRPRCGAGSSPPSCGTPPTQRSIVDGAGRDLRVEPGRGGPCSDGSGPRSWATPSRPSSPTRTARSSTPRGPSWPSGEAPRPSLTSWLRPDGSSVDRHDPPSPDPLRDGRFAGAVAHRAGGPPEDLDSRLVHGARARMQP